MIKAKHDFHEVLEQYVFEIASTFIEPAQPATQASFISLLNRIDSSATPNKPLDNHSDVIISQQLEKQWHQILSEPVNWQSIHRQWMIGVLQQRMKSNELYIVNLRIALRTMLKQYRYTQMTIIREPYRSNLLERHKRVLNMYRQHLAQIRKFQASSEEQLNQLQKQ